MSAVKVAILVEGKTEKVFMPFLRKLLESQLRDHMPQIKSFPYDGLIPSKEKLQRVVANHLKKWDYVIALTDVYTGSQPPVFKDASEAKKKMREWVGDEPRFHPHAAQHDFEAWLLPFWPSIQKLAIHNKNAPSGPPEEVNHGNPPAYRIKEIFELGKARDSYIKTRDAIRILEHKDNDLMLSVQQNPELKALVNTILRVSGGSELP